MGEYNLPPRELRRWAPQKPTTIAIYTARDPVIYGAIMNLSESGGCVATATPLPIGSTVHVHLSFYRQSGLFEADARPIWSRQAGDFAKTMKPLLLHGLRFDLGQTDKKKLLHLLETSGFELTFLPSPDEFLSLADDLAADLERLGASLSKSTGGKTASE